MPHNEPKQDHLDKDIGFWALARKHKAFVFFSMTLAEDVRKNIPQLRKPKILVRQTRLWFLKKIGIRKQNSTK